MGNREPSLITVAERGFRPFSASVTVSRIEAFDRRMAITEVNRGHANSRNA